MWGKQLFSCAIARYVAHSQWPTKTDQHIRTLRCFRFQNEFTDTRTATLKASFLEKRISDSQSNRMTLTIWVHCIDRQHINESLFHQCISWFACVDAGLARTRQGKNVLPPSHPCITRIQTERWYAMTCPTTKRLVVLNTGVRSDQTCICLFLFRLLRIVFWVIWLWMRAVMELLWYFRSCAPCCATKYHYFWSAQKTIYHRWFQKKKLRSACLPFPVYYLSVKWEFDLLPVHRLCKVVNAEHVTTSARLDVGVEEAFLKLAESA